jgi:hypothetical protein
VSLLLLFMMCLSHDGVLCDWMPFPLLCVDSCISNTQPSRSTYLRLCSSILFCLSQSTAAVWEDKFIAKTNLKERLSNFFDEAKCMSEGDGIAQCVIDELGKDAEWTSSVEQAVATAEPCFVKAAAEGDIAKVFDCVRLVWDVADKYCSTESARKACDPSSSSSSDGYGLRGSSSFNEEAEKDVDWVKVKCEAEQSKAKWRAEMEKRTGQAKLHAQKRYEEAKAAALRAEARFTPAAKEAWEKVKAAHDETWEGAKKWWDRHFGDVSDFEYGEDEFDVQC